jgi:hypothetical protein
MNSAANVVIMVKTHIKCCGDDAYFNLLTFAHTATQMIICICKTKQMW